MKLTLVQLKDYWRSLVRGLSIENCVESDPRSKSLIIPDFCLKSSLVQYVLVFHGQVRLRVRFLYFLEFCAKASYRDWKFTQPKWFADKRFTSTPQKLAFWAQVQTRAKIARNLANFDISHKYSSGTVGPRLWAWVSGELWTISTL